MTAIREHKRLLAMTKAHPRFMRMRPLLHVETTKGPEAVYEVLVGDFEAEAPSEGLPVLGLVGGVHGIEAIGVKILVAFLEQLGSQLPWNRQLISLLGSMRLCCIPILNPAGFLAQTRANGRGVDLMRNSPVESSEKTPFIGGQRISRYLPYYRGNGELEPETQCLVDWVYQRVFTAPFSITLDIHSGFGFGDYIWTPFAKRKGFPPQWPCYNRLHQLIDTTLPNHKFRFCPQSESYRTAGDIWDYLLDLHEREPAGSRGQFLPLTLEVGSWSWIKKSPKLQLQSWDFFNPIPPHRRQRVLRHHTPLLALLQSITGNYEVALGDDLVP